MVDSMAFESNHELCVDMFLSSQPSDLTLHHFRSTAFAIRHFKSTQTRIIILQVYRTSVLNRHFMFSK